MRKCGNYIGTKIIQKEGFNVDPECNVCNPLLPTIYDEIRVCEKHAKEVLKNQLKLIRELYPNLGVDIKIPSEILNKWEK